MRKFLTKTSYVPLFLKEAGKGFQLITQSDGKRKEFKTRKAVEAFCHKHRYVYVEEKYIFYR